MSRIFAAERDEEIVDDLLVENVAAERGNLVVGDGFFEERLVLVLLHRLVDQGRVRGRVLRLVGADGFEIAGVCDDRGEFLELVELGGGGGGAHILGWKVPLERCSSPLGKATLK